MKKKLVLAVFLTVLLLVSGCGGGKSDEKSSVISDLESNVKKSDKTSEEVEEAATETTKTEATEIEMTEIETLESEQVELQTVSLPQEEIQEIEEEEIEKMPVVDPIPVDSVSSGEEVNENIYETTEIEEETETKKVIFPEREINITRRVIEPIFRASFPTALALDTDNNLYSISYNLSPGWMTPIFIPILAMINTASGEKMSEISVPLSIPDDIDISYDNKCLYIADVEEKVVINENGENTVINGLSKPAGVAVDHKKKHLYFTDTGTHNIYSLDLSDNSISLLAGSGIAGYSDGTGDSAEFNTPVGIAIDVSDDVLYIADTANNMIRKINIATREVISFAGSGDEKTIDGIGAEASFCDPAYISIDHEGTKLYVVEYDGETIREVNIATKAVGTVIGQSFGLKEPRDIVVGNDDSTLFLADYGNHQIMEISLNEPKTVTIFLGNKYLIPRTGQTVSYYANDDGNIRMGVPWPDPRFTDNSDGTVTDNLTGLMWTKDVAVHCSCCMGNCLSNNERQEQAVNFCEEFSYAGYDDWRMPSIVEMESLLNYRSDKPILSEDHSFINDSLCDSHWLSASDATFNIKSGTVNRNVHPYECICTWPVRDTDNGFVELNKINLPNPRFTDNGDGTVTDNLTDLVWVKDMNLIKAIDPEYSSKEDEPQRETNIGLVTWEKAMNWCNNLIYAGCDDWRMPNRREMISLLSFHLAGQLLLPDSNPFIADDVSIRVAIYWSSTGNEEKVYIIEECFGSDKWESCRELSKENKFKVWPVRGGFKF